MAKSAAVPRSNDKRVQQQRAKRAADFAYLDHGGQMNSGLKEAAAATSISWWPLCPHGEFVSGRSRGDDDEDD